MKNKMILLAGFAIALWSSAFAQPTQDLRGNVGDQVLQQPLAGATVLLMPGNKQAIADSNGNFRFNNLPIGIYRLTVSHTGYREVVVDNVAMNAGKETVLQVSMEASLSTGSEVRVKAVSRKNKPVNDMSLVSARAFSVEETQRYAAAVNDPLRMATAFPGVLAGEDGGNAIIIRGNAPAGLLWKMEGLDIPNPNHFSSVTTSGGGISILSAQLLGNSDFLTAAFAPEYGNALSGVFDLHLRKGNDEKKEYTLQAGVLGLNVAMEGPFSKNYKGSYLFNYRYSTLALLNSVGVLGDNANTRFQDLSYNISLPTPRAGMFTVFGFGGLSGESGKGEQDSAKWEKRFDRAPYKVSANTFMNGITHTVKLARDLQLKTATGISYTRNRYREEYITDDLSLIPEYRDDLRTRKIMVSSTLNYRVSKALSIRTGISADMIHFSYFQLAHDYDGEPLTERINAKGNMATQQAFVQGQYRVSEALQFTGGLHYLRLSLNGRSALEPRMAASWHVSRRSTLGFGYGRHSQLQVPGIYFTKQEENGQEVMVNKDLDFTRANHVVASWTYRLAPKMIIKTEAYWQQLYHVPVSVSDSSRFSVLNMQDGYIAERLENKGTGYNHGVEISLERYLEHNFYFTLSNSLYSSRYKAADGIERNTRFNGNHIATLIGGKDFVSWLGTKTVGINVKIIYAGGLRTTPIDLEESRIRQGTVYKESQAFSERLPGYFRSDLRLSMKWNRKHFTSTLSLDVQNVTNRLNVYDRFFDAQKGEIVTVHQTGLIPVLNYKIEF